MNQTMIIRAGSLIEQLRLKWHFIWTERQLRRRDTNDLSETQQSKRLRLIDHLRTYGRRGVFPINTQYPHKTPIFVDDEGRRCAVADLMVASGHSHIVDVVSAQANTAYVQEMKFPQLDQWAAEHGFTRAELAKIQPAYPVFLSLVTINTTIMWAGLLAVIAGFANWVRPWQAQRKGRLITALAGLLAGLGLILSSFGLTRNLYPAAAYIFGPVSDLCSLGGYDYLIECRPVSPDEPCPEGMFASCGSRDNIGYFVRLNFLFPFAPYAPYSAHISMVASEDRPGFPFPPAVPPVQNASGEPSKVIMTTYNGNLIWGLTLAGYIIDVGLMLYGGIKLILQRRRPPDGEVELSPS